jgi:hypothetical protein
MTDLKHIGVVGMRWGVHKDDESGRSEKARRINSDILKKNPNAAVVNYDIFKKIPLSPAEIETRNRNIRNVAIGVGIGLTVAAGAILYTKNKKAVDGAIGNFFKKILIRLMFRNPDL